MKSHIYQPPKESKPKIGIIGPHRPRAGLSFDLLSSMLDGPYMEMMSPKKQPLALPRKEKDP